MIIFYQIIWLFLPAGIANMMAAISIFIFPKWNYPIDCKKEFKGKRIFGDHKTWRGLIIGTLSGGLIFLLQRFLFNSYPHIQDISLVNYQNTSWLFGCLIGFGALFADAIKSFFKRQVGIPSGKSWFPFDQLDWVIGAILVISIFVKLSLSIIIVALILGLIIHLIAKIIGYILKINKSPI